LNIENEAEPHISAHSFEEAVPQASQTQPPSTSEPFVGPPVEARTLELPDPAPADQKGSQPGSASGAKKPPQVPGTWDTIKTQAGETWQDVTKVSGGMWEVVTSGDFWTSLPGVWWDGASKAASWALVRKPSDFLMWATNAWKDHSRGPHFSSDLELTVISTEDEVQQTFKFKTTDSSVNGTCSAVSKNGKQFILMMLGRKSSSGRYFSRGSETLWNDQMASLVLQFAHRISSQPKDQRFGIVDFRYTTLESGKNIRIPDPSHKTGLSKQTIVYVDHDIDINREQLDAQELSAEGGSLDGRHLFQLKGQLKCKFSNDIIPL
jgi:hypothetical protein